MYGRRAWVSAKSHPLFREAAFSLSPKSSTVTMNETKSLNQSTPIHDELFYWENVVFLVRPLI